MKSHLLWLHLLFSSPKRATCHHVSEVPSNYFCGRYGHTAAGKGDSLFVYGGLREPLAFNGSLLVQLDLSRSWDAFKGGPRMSFIDHGGTSTDSPSLFREGGLFQNNDASGTLFVYGGGTANLTIGKSSSRSNSLVDNNLRSISPVNGSWASQELGLEATFSPQQGASVQDGQQGLAFYFNGVVGNKESREPHPRMIVLDLHNRTARNVSTATISPSGARVGATLQYVPAIGKKGALVLIGGGIRQKDDDANTHELGRTMAPLDTIHVLDIASLDDGEGTWYQQKTNGRTPESRADSCAITIASPDGTGFHIYMFAGRSQAKAFDEIWVLSLPQFRWTKVFNGTHPSYGVVCQLVGAKQMMVLGGNDFEKRREHCDESKIFLFELTNLKWTPTYVKNGNPYRVPKAVYEWVGGTGMGEANMTEPEGGFESQGLATLFNASRSASLGHGDASASARLCSRLWLAVLISMVSICSYLR